MRTCRLFVASLLLALIASSSRADSIFMYCPTIFNNDISNITANTYFTIVGAPEASCGVLPENCKDKDLPGGFKVLIDGADADGDLLGCNCDDSTNKGYWTISIQTPLTHTYNITAYTKLPESSSPTSSTCLVKRAQFQPSFTVPELSPLLLPFLMFVALLIMRRGKRN